MDVFKPQENILVIREWEEAGVHAYFTTRKGGVSTAEFASNNLAFQVGDKYEDVLANREAIAKTIGTPLENFVFAKQNHTSNIVKITSKEKGLGTTSFESGIVNCDAMYTFEPNIVLAAFYADCTPVYVYCPNTKLIGVIHAGWQGTVSAITYKFIEKICSENGVIASDLKLIIGPAISKECFEVEQEVIDSVKNLKMINSATTFTKINERKYILDVKKLNELQALAAGVKAENILVSNHCTYSEDLFFSYRREGQTGRMLALITRDFEWLS
ncbi:MAG: peptidoglycan editing factor PgeF [Mycoplasmatales bacterium]